MKKITNIVLDVICIASLIGILIISICFGGFMTAPKEHIRDIIDCVYLYIIFITIFIVSTSKVIAANKPYIKKKKKG